MSDIEREAEALLNSPAAYAEGFLPLARALVLAERALQADDIRCGHCDFSRRTNRDDTPAHICIEALRPDVIAAIAALKETGLTPYMPTTRKDLQELLLNSGGRMLYDGKDWDIKSKPIGPGIYKVFCKEHLP